MIDMMEQKTILIVDDENMMREAVASYLEKQGYHVLQAETGTQALSLLEKETVSFVILDLMLPDISGEEICSRIRRQSRIPIIMLTAKTMEDDKWFKPWSRRLYHQAFQPEKPVCQDPGSMAQVRP